MSGHQTGTIEDTIYFWMAANDTSGSGGDGATPLFDVREAGAAADAIPLLSGTPTLLTHANFPPGCHEIAVAATTGNGFAADDTFSVFCTLAIDSQNPSGFVGSCTLTPLAKDGTVLKPTTAGRTLDVTAAGEAGLDLDNTSGTWAAAQFAANWLVAAGIAAGALDDKGNWNIGKTGYALTQSFPTNFADMSISVTTGLVDITQTAADKVWASAARTLTALGFTLGASDFAAGFMTASKFGAGAIDATALDATAVDEIVDGVYDEDIVAAHGTADTAGLILRALGAVISQRTNNATLNALLGIPDTAGTDLPEQTWAETARFLTASTNFNDISEANVLTQVNAGLDASIPELTAGVPAATPSLRTAQMFIYMGLRNKRDTTSASDEIHNDAGAVIATAVLSDDTVTYISGEYA